MRYTPFRRRMYGLSGLGLPQVEEDGPLVRWFERKQHAGWCELYPHLLEAMAAGQRARAAGNKFQAVLNASDWYLPDDLKRYLQEEANECFELANRCKKIVDLLYAVKDYVLGADFGKEGWRYEAWCRTHGYPLKSARQIEQEAERAGLGGIPVLVVGGITVVMVVYFIADAVQFSIEQQRRATLIEREQTLCNGGDKKACERAAVVVGAVGGKIRDEGRKDTPFGSIATAVKWAAFGLLGVVALKAFMSSKYAVKKESAP